jgi:hypothetical protein
MQLSHYRPVKLMFPDELGQYHQEYIPTSNFFTKKYQELENRYTLKRGRPFYYWHHYYLLTPIERKVLDLNFILHVQNDHSEENPVDYQEYKHYEKIYPNYQKEVEYFLIESAKKFKKDKHAKSIRLQKDPYILAYKKHWIDTFNLGPNIKLFYHGVGLDENIDFLDTIIKELEQEEQEIAKKYDLTIKELNDAFKYVSPESIKKSQIPPKEQQIATKTGFKILFWVANAFYTIATVYVLVSDTMAGDSINSRLIDGLIMVVFIQVLFLTPYFTIIGIYKLVKWIKSRYFPKTAEQETQSED